MSFINDALKKTQAKLGKKKPSAQTNKPIEQVYDKLHQLNEEYKERLSPVPAEVFVKEDAPDPKNKKIWFNTTVASICLFLILLGAFSASLFHLMSQSKKSSAKSTESQYVTTFDTLTLNGTIMMGDKRVALINNEIYETGDYIRGMKIINIDMKKIEMLSNGEIVILEVRKKQ